MVTIVVPAFNEEMSVAAVLREIDSIRPLLPSSEVIVVDDGSTDKTSEEISQFDFVKYVRHVENLGKGAALHTAIQNTNSEVVVVQDADMEYPPSEIPGMVTPILEGKADVVFGSRFLGNSNGMSISHYIGNKILSLATSLLYRTRVTDVMTGHKCFRLEVFKEIDFRFNGFEMETALTANVLNHGWKLTEVPITFRHRMHGKAKIRYLDGLRSLIALVREFGSRRASGAVRSIRTAHSSETRYNSRTNRSSDDPKRDL